MTVVDADSGYTAPDASWGASVFPKIPGVDRKAVYLISEKASDVIIEDAQSAIEKSGPSADHSG